MSHVINACEYRLLKHIKNHPTISSVELQKYYNRSEAVLSEQLLRLKQNNFIESDIEIYESEYLCIIGSSNTYSITSIGEKFLYDNSYIALFYSSHERLVNLTLAIISIASFINGVFFS